MTKRSIRYKKPEWHEWCYLVVEENEVEKTVAALKAEGYLVEK